MATRPEIRWTFGDKVLHQLYRIAPEPFAERISLLIWRRQCARRWNDALKAHLANGGLHIVQIKGGRVVRETLA